MNYSININQIALCEHFAGINLKQASLVDYCSRLANGRRIEKKVLDNVNFFRVKYEKVCQDMPLLGINNDRVMARNFDALVKLGILERHPDNTIDCKSFFAFTEKSEVIWSREPMHSKVQTPTLKSTDPYTEECIPPTLKSVYPPTLNSVDPYTLESVHYNPNTNPNTNPITLSKEKTRSIELQKFPENGKPENGETQTTNQPNEPKEIPGGTVEAALLQVVEFFTDNEPKYYRESWGISNIKPNEWTNEIKDWLHYHESESWFLANIKKHITGGQGSLRSWFRKEWKLAKYGKPDLSKPSQPENTYYEPSPYPSVKEVLARV